MRIPRSLFLAVVVGLLLSACATEGTPISADATQPSTTAAVALVTTVPGGAVTEPQATTTASISPTTTAPTSMIAAALEPVEEEPPAEIREWTPETALAVSADPVLTGLERRTLAHTTIFRAPTGRLRVCETCRCAARSWRTRSIAGGALIGAEESRLGV